VDLGSIGVWMPHKNDPALALEIEQLGYGALWLGSSPSVDDARPFIEASERMPIVTGILNIWRHDPADVARDHARITTDHPGRFLLGVGIGHPESTSDWAHPVQAMEHFFDGLDAAEPPVPVDQRVTAALRPRMLDLAKQRSLGAHPYFVPSEHTAFARERLGPDVLLAPEVSIAIDDDLDVARDRASRWATGYFGFSNYLRNLRAFGFEDRDFEEGGSDALLDATVPHGPVARVAAGVRAHLDAGADHVCVQPVGVGAEILPDLEALASELGLGAR
jgi:probable F420-dependent oxidoreductase